MRRSALLVSRTILDCFPRLRLRQVDGQVAKRWRSKWSEQRKCSVRITPRKQISSLQVVGRLSEGLERVEGAFFTAVVRENFGPAIFGGGPMALLMYAARCHHIGSGR